jgi:hypothetical protein
MYGQAEVAGVWRLEARSGLGEVTCIAGGVRSSPSLEKIVGTARVGLAESDRSRGCSEVSLLADLGGGVGGHPNTTSIEEEVNWFADSVVLASILAGGDASDGDDASKSSTKRLALRQPLVYVLSNAWV